MTFDKATELLGIDPAITFDSKLSELEKAGKIGEGERTILDVLTDAGGAAAHRGWKPTPYELDTLISILEGFIDRTLVLPSKAKQLADTIPARPPRKKR